MAALLQTVTASDARARFGELVDSAYYNDATILIIKMGKPVAKITKADDVKPSRDLSAFVGAWDDKDGEIIEREAKKFRKNFKLFRE